MHNQYRKERLKLTGLYLGIILFIVTIFSILVLHSQNQQLRRFERPERGSFIRTRPFSESEEERAVINEIVSQIKRDNFNTILSLDIIILILSSVLSYYLAGKTMEPILKTLDKQNRFVSDASHELKTPLTNIMTEAEVLYRDKKTTNEEYKDFAKNVIDDVKHLNSLVVSLLDTAKFDNQEIKVNEEEVDLVKLNKDIADKFKEYSKKKNVEINIIPESDNIKAITDKSLMQRLISIFIDNAIKYNKVNGKIDILINNDKSITIKDSGVGISKDNLTKIFDRFYRESEDRNVKGFGLGLSIAKQLAELLNIDIEVESEPGKGSSFKLNLP